MQAARRSGVSRFGSAAEQLCDFGFGRLSFSITAADSLPLMCASGQTVAEEPATVEHVTSFISA